MLKLLYPLKQMHIFHVRADIFATFKLYPITFRFKATRTECKKYIGVGGIELFSHTFIIAFSFK